MTTAMSTLLFFSLAAGCNGKDAEEAEAPTYTRDVAPIVDSRCAGCHEVGGIAPFSLTTYDEVSLYADLVARSVADRLMPPAQPADGCATYTPDPSLTQDEIDTITRWADAGAPEGDPADATEVAPRQDPAEIDRVDLAIQLPEPYVVTEPGNEYRCFVVDWPEERDVYVTGVGVEPGNPAIVHHVIAYLFPSESVATIEALDAADEGPGYACYGGPLIERTGDRPAWLGGWAPGGTGRNMPEGSGILVEAGSKLVIQVHYHADDNAVPATDQSSLLVKVDDAVETPGEMVPFTDFDWVLAENMPIPAGSDDLVYTTSTAWAEDARIYDVGLHMHTLGRAGSLKIQHSDGSETCLLDMDTWDFDWQLAYRLDAPALLAAGDSLSLSCVFDNPTDVEVNWGENTEDEMCLGVLYMTAAD